AVNDDIDPSMPGGGHLKVRCVTGCLRGYGMVLSLVAVFVAEQGLADDERFGAVATVMVGTEQFVFAGSTMADVDAAPAPATPQDRTAAMADQVFQLHIDGRIDSARQVGAPSIGVDDD